MTLTKEQIDKMKELYNSNKEALVKVKNYIREYGCTDDGVTDATESFEQGYNNALEYVFEILGIKDYER